MSEGLSAANVGKEIEQHALAAQGDGKRDSRLSIAEAILLSVVALLAAWSGYAAAKWSTESRVHLAESTTLRTQANRAQTEALVLRNFDASTFTAWFAAYIAHDKNAMRIAVRRFRPGFAAAFAAWRETNPETNPNAPPGPTYMPQYKAPGLAKARMLDIQADAAFRDGVNAGTTADKYVRLTVLLASILFLVGISTQFRLTRVRYGLVAFGCILLVLSVVQLATLPRPHL